MMHSGNDVSLSPKVYLDKGRRIHMPWSWTQPIDTQKMIPKNTTVAPFEECCRISTKIAKARLLQPLNISWLSVWIIYNHWQSLRLGMVAVDAQRSFALSGTGCNRYPYFKQYLSFGNSTETGVRYSDLTDCSCIHAFLYSVFRDHILKKRLPQFAIQKFSSSAGLTSQSLSVAKAPRITKRDFQVVSRRSQLQPVSIHLLVHWWTVP